MRIDYFVYSQCLPGQVPGRITLPVGLRKVRDTDCAPFRMRSTGNTNDVEIRLKDIIPMSSSGDAIVHDQGHHDILRRVTAKRQVLTNLPEPGTVTVDPVPG